MPENLASYGGWALAAGLGVKEFFSFLKFIMTKDRRNGGSSSVDLAVLTSVVEAQTGIIGHIEADGSVKFQNHEAEDRQWKRGTEKRLKDHSDKIIIQGEGLHSQAKVLAVLKTQHEALKEKGGG